MEIEKQVQNLRLEDVLPNRFQPRIRFSEDSINELANSIKEHGVIQPIVVRRIGDKYEIIAGERRYKASQIAGRETIPAIISDLDDSDSAEIALLENVQRENLTPIEEAISYKKILDMGYTQEQLAQKIGNKQSTIANKVRLLNLTDEVQEALLENKISERHARSLLKISDSSLQVKMLERIITGRFTVRKTDEEIEKLLKGELEMNENNELTTTIPTSKIYEEEVQKTVEEPTVAPIPTIEPVSTQAEIKPVPLEVEEKVDMVMPIMPEMPVKDQPYDTKFLEKETFVNMPMHNIPTTQPLGENSEYKDGKYFELPKGNDNFMKEDNRFNNIFGDNQTVIETEKDEIVMPTFDFSNVSPLDNIETVSFGEEVAAPSFTSSLTDIPSVEGLSIETSNVPTLEKIDNGLNLSMENIEISNEIPNNVTNTQNDINLENSVIQPTSFEVNNNEVLVGQPLTSNEIKLEDIQLEEATASTMPETKLDETIMVENKEEVVPMVEMPTVVENLDSTISSTLEVPTVEVPSVEPTLEPVLESNPVIESAIAPIPTLEPVSTQAEMPIVESLEPVASSFGVSTTEMSSLQPTLEPVVKEVEIPTLREYTIPTFDPEMGSSIEVVNEDIRPLDLVVENVEVETKEEKEEPTEIKLPFDITSIESLKNDFLKILQDKGFNVSVEDMDLADNYKLIFTIEK